MAKPARKQRDRRFGGERRTDTLDPVKMGRALEKLTDPLASLTEAVDQLEDKGLRWTLTRFLDRCRASGVGHVIDRVKQVKGDELSFLLENRAHTILDSIDELDLSQAGLKDKAIAVGIFLEKRALLRGEPTQILSYAERKNLNELMPELIREAHRRGITVELTPGDYQVMGEAPEVRALPPDEVQLEAVSATARRMRPKAARGEA